LNWKTVLAILSCNIVFMSASYTMLIPFLPMYLTQELGVDAASVNLWSGIVFSSTFLVSAIMAPIWGRMADTKGKRLMAIRASILLTISYFLGGIVTSPEQLTLMRIFQGFAAGLWPMDLAIMTLYAPPEKLGLCLGTMQGVLTGGGVIGPLLGGILAEFFGMRVSFFLAAAGLLFNSIVFIFFIKEPPNPADKDTSREESTPAEKSAASSLLHIPLIRNMLLCGMLVQMVILILQPIMTTYITKLAGNLPNLIFVSGLIFSLGGIAGAITAPLWGRFGQHHGFFKTMSLALVFAGISITIQGIPENLYWFAGMQFTGGLFFSGIYPSINAILAANTPARFKGSVFGLFFSSQQIGSMIGPLLGGAIATFLGMKYVFFTAGIILVILSFTVHHHFMTEPAIKASTETPMK